MFCFLTYLFLFSFHIHKFAALYHHLDHQRVLQPEQEEQKYIIVPTVTQYLFTDVAFVVRRECDLSFVDCDCELVGNKAHTLYVGRRRGSILIIRQTDTDYHTIMHHKGNEISSFMPSTDECINTRKVEEIGGIICDVCNNIYISLNVKKELWFDPSTGHIHKYSSAGSFPECIVKR